MTTVELEHLYFEWLYRLVCDDRYSGGDRTSYRRLLTYLNGIDFKYENKRRLDANRAADGIDLRHEFGFRMKINDHIISQELDTRRCSILEMMVALAIRCEESARDQTKGDRTGQWFWSMLRSLGLAGMNDLDFDERVVDHVISDFQENTYSPNGEGGLFTLYGDYGDIRKQEIIWQMFHFLNENEF